MHVVENTLETLGTVYLLNVSYLVSWFESYELYDELCGVNICADQ